MNRLFVFLLLPVVIFAQSSNWNSVVDLNLNVTANDRLDLYTDKDGIHILVENGSTLKYYLYSLAGSQVRTSTIDNFHIIHFQQTGRLGRYNLYFLQRRIYHLHKTIQQCRTNLVGIRQYILK